MIYLARASESQSSEYVKQSVPLLTSLGICSVKDLWPDLTARFSFTVKTYPAQSKDSNKETPEGTQTCVKQNKKKEVNNYSGSTTIHRQEHRAAIREILLVLAHSML